MIRCAAFPAQEVDYPTDDQRPFRFMSHQICALDRKHEKKNSLDLVGHTRLLYPFHA
jgi:hypothetical protein